MEKKQYKYFIESNEVKGRIYDEYYYYYSFDRLIFENDFGLMFHLYMCENDEIYDLRLKKYNATKPNTIVVPTLANNPCNT